jgi:hypothetical protein
MINPLAATAENERPADKAACLEENSIELLPRDYITLVYDEIINFYECVTALWVQQVVKSVRWRRRADKIFL